MYRVTRSFLILLALPALLNASIVVRGKVLDRNSREPIVGANVVVMGADEGGATDIEGYFEFPSSSSYPFTLEVTHIGFQRQEVHVSADTLLIISMEPGFLMGEDVVVIGDRSQVGADVSSAIDVITSIAIESFGARDVGDALRPLPSVVINASTTGKQTVSIRGSNPNEVAVFLDGLRLNDSNTGLADLSAIDLNDLERVEVVKGGATTLFGQGAFGGVVSLTSRLPDSNQVSFTRGYGLTDQRDQDLSLSATGRLGIFAAGGRYSGKSRRYDGKCLYTNIFNSLSAASYPRFGELAAKLYRLNNYLELPDIGVAQSDHSDLASVTYDGSLLTSRDWNLFLGQRDWGWTDHFFTNLERQLEEGNLTGRIAKQIINDKMSSTLQLSYEKQHFTGENRRRSYIGTHHNRAQLERTNLGYAAVVRLIAEDVAKIASRVRLEMSFRGDQFITDHQQDTWEADSSGTVGDTLLLVDNRWQSTLFTRRIGVRMEGNTPFVHYAFFMNVGRNQRQPSLNDQFLWHNSVDEELRESPLEPEYVATTDIGLNLIYLNDTYGTIPYELGINASVFVNQYDNKIAYRFYEDRPPVPINAELAQISGYELALEGSFWARRIRAQLAYQRINLDDPLIFPNKPESRISYLMELQLPLLVIAFDYYKDGPQFILSNGFVDAQRVESRESANLNVMLRRRVWRLQISIAYTIRNLFSDLPVLANSPGYDTNFPFQYYESHRKILTFRISL